MVMHFTCYLIAMHIKPVAIGLSDPVFVIIEVLVVFWKMIKV